MTTNAMDEAEAGVVAEQPRLAPANGQQGHARESGECADVETTFDQFLTGLLTTMGSAEERRAYADRLDELFPAEC